MLLLLVIGAVFYVSQMSEHLPDNQVSARDYKNATYTVAGEKVRLVNGRSETAVAPGSASRMETRYFGNEISKDLDGDGRDDIAFLITQNSGGSGTFFYVVAAVNKEHGYEGSDAVLLGDRIAPQATESGPGKSIIVNYLDRLPNQPMTAAPSDGKSMRLILDARTMQFGVFHSGARKDTSL